MKEKEQQDPSKSDWEILKLYAKIYMERDYMKPTLPTTGKQDTWFRTMVKTENSGKQPLETTGLPEPATTKKSWKTEYQLKKDYQKYLQVFGSMTSKPENGGTKDLDRVLKLYSTRCVPVKPITRMYGSQLRTGLDTLPQGNHEERLNFAPVMTWTDLKKGYKEPAKLPVNPPTVPVKNSVDSVPLVIPAYSPMTLNELRLSPEQRTILAELGYFKGEVLCHKRSKCVIVRVGYDRVVRLDCRDGCYDWHCMIDVAKRLSNPDIWPTLKYCTRVYKYSYHFQCLWFSIEMPFYVMINPNKNIHGQEARDALGKEIELLRPGLIEEAGNISKSLYIDNHTGNWGYDRNLNLKYVDCWGC